MHGRRTTGRGIYLKREAHRDNSETDYSAHASKTDLSVDECGGLGSLPPPPPPPPLPVGGYLTAAWGSWVL